MPNRELNDAINPANALKPLPEERIEEQTWKENLRDDPLWQMLMELTGVAPSHRLVEQIQQMMSPVTRPQSPSWDLPATETYGLPPGASAPIDTRTGQPMQTTTPWASMESAKGVEYADRMAGMATNTAETALSAVDLAGLAGLTQRGVSSLARTYGDDVLSMLSEAKAAAPSLANQQGIISNPLIDLAKGAGKLGGEYDDVVGALNELSVIDQMLYKDLKANPVGHRGTNWMEISEHLKGLDKRYEQYPTGPFREMLGYPDPGTNLMKRVRDVEKKTGTPILDEQGNLMHSAMEERPRIDPGTGQVDTSQLYFPGFKRSLTQTYLDNMDGQKREGFRRALTGYVEDLYTSGAPSRIMSKKLGSIASSDLRVAPAVKNAEKTLGAVNINSQCPMFNIGAHGCYLDGCYVTSMGRNSGQSFNLYRSAVYTGELLQFADETIEALNKVGGLRMNGSGDMSIGELDQAADILKHAGMRGLKLKWITKQDDSFKIIDSLQKHQDPIVRKKAREMVLQPSLDPYWIPIAEDEIPGSLADIYDLGKVEAKGRPEVAIKMYKKQGRDAKLIDGKAYRKYGYSWDQINQLQQQYPGVRVAPRVVVSTPKEIAEYALKMPKVIQTWMHAKIRPGMYSDIEGKMLGEGALNFDKRIAVYKDDTGWHLKRQVGKGSTRKMGEGGAYKATEDYIKSNYTEAQQDKIFRTLKGQLDENPGALCCSSGASLDACMDCTSHCMAGTYQIGNRLQKMADRGMGLGK